MADRRLVTFERIGAIDEIPKADAIEAATIRGWTVVTKKGEFGVGDEVVYFEIDSFLPLDDARFAFLEARGSKTVDGVRGHVLKTAKLRGTYSQGLIMPTANFPEFATGDGPLEDRIGVTKYEPPIPESMSGEIAGPFPSKFAPKTDAERVQNLGDVFDTLRTEHTWIATEKIDGTSTTYINDDGALRVCGRNWELARGNSTPWRIADELGMLSRLPAGFAVQGELFGEGIRSNPLGVKGVRFLAFSVLKEGRYLPRGAWPDELREFAVPVLDVALPDSVAETVEQADDLKSVVAPGRLAEGIVWHAADGGHIFELDGRSCFKAISNKWLLKHG